MFKRKNILFQQPTKVFFYFGKQKHHRKNTMYKKVNNNTNNIIYCKSKFLRIYMQSKAS